MKIVAHLSDLHFGTEDPAIAAALLEELDGRNAPLPTLVAISGDLTQRAREHEFRAGREFLDRLPSPYLVVAGNHDVPLYDVFSRLTNPLGKYRTYITEDLDPSYHDDELVVVGVTTAHGFTRKAGRITAAQLESARARLVEHRARWKLVLAHHPFVVPSTGDAGDGVAGADAALQVFTQVGVDIILTGHLHLAHASDAAFRTADRSIISIHAGTCMSTRTRGESNGYNLLKFTGDDLAIVHRVWDGRRFVDGAAKAYRRAPDAVHGLIAHVKVGP